MATIYQELFKKHGVEAALVSLEDKIFWERGDSLKTMEQEFFIPADKFVFIMPEYNGSYPGSLKLMMDNSDIKACWYGKKAALTGVADGRAGNLRGLDHFTNVLNYLQVNVYYNKLPFSKIGDELSRDGRLLKASSLDCIRGQIAGFIAF
jgi:multimeric flavodoxin WrbA